MSKITQKAKQLFSVKGEVQAPKLKALGAASVVSVAVADAAGYNMLSRDAITTAASQIKTGILDAGPALGHLGAGGAVLVGLSAVPAAIGSAIWMAKRGKNTTPIDFSAKVTEPAEKTTEAN